MMDVDATDMCCLYTWSVTCDYQLSLLATVLLFILIRNRKLGYVAFGIAFLLALFIPGFITYRNNLFVSPVPTIQHAMYYRENNNNIIYTKSYARAGSYLVGMAMGYVIFQYNPAKYRNTISKKWSVIGIIVAITLMLASMAAGKITTDNPYDPIEFSIISAINRPVWAIAVCIIIGICEYGNSLYIRNILSWRVFIPLSRLSYGMYLSHLAIISRNVSSSRSPNTFDMFSMTIDALGVFVMATAVSAVLWILVEAPLNKISGHFLFRRNKEDIKK
ncbi:hypothetical protein K1T71_012430 [Dendrolimus kikuchii]|uniref:Uncharacterized protein n=1 Tax=Dendrolimus kikuchii TaxID=765133 RepID=A0ACC1CJM7_9NEOP|nr:hypothetical protein K1T71_012430 [Dendrolimus kikuchii]